MRISRCRSYKPTGTFYYTISLQINEIDKIINTDHTYYVYDLVIDGVVTGYLRLYNSNTPKKDYWFFTVK